MELIESIVRLLRDYLYLFSVFFFVLYIFISNQESSIFVKALRNDFTSLDNNFTSLEWHTIDGRVKKMSRSRQESCLAMGLGYYDYTAHNFSTISVIGPWANVVATVHVKLQWIGSPPHHVR